MAKDWFLLADIGGTNARFALGDIAGCTICEYFTVSVADHPTFMSALQTYLAHVQENPDWARLPIDGCLAVASPAYRDVITFTNSDWVIDRRDLSFSLQLPSLHVINDFAAIGHASSGFGDDDWVQIGDGAAQPDRPIAVLGPGTGLGVCGALPGPHGATVISGEGGHADFSPVGDEEIEILRHLLTRYRRVSAERLLSGAGLQNIYWALNDMRGSESRHATPADISAAALRGEDSIAVETLAVFCRVLGGFAGNLALTYGARGGVYIAGGIVPRVLDFLKGSEFRDRFLAKGRFRDYLNDIPTRIVTRDNPGLLGALRYLQSRHQA